MTDLPGDPPPEPPAERLAARAAKDRLRDQLAGDDRVNGIGITRWRHRYAVRVSVVDAGAVPDLPEEVDGIPVRVVVVGRIVAQEEGAPPEPAG